MSVEWQLRICGGSAARAWRVIVCGARVRLCVCLAVSVLLMCVGVRRHGFFLIATSWIVDRLLGMYAHTVLSAALLL